MKHLSLIFVVLTGLAVFMIGAIPHYSHPAIGYVLMGVGVVLIGAFYLITLIDVLKSPTVKKSRRITWLILIVCAPLLGNLIYFFFHNALMTPQVPEPGSNY